MKFHCKHDEYMAKSSTVQTMGILTHTHTLCGVTNPYIFYQTQIHCMLSIYLLLLIFFFVRFGGQFNLKCKLGQKWVLFKNSTKTGIGIFINHKTDAHFSSILNVQCSHTL